MVIAVDSLLRYRLSLLRLFPFLFTFTRRVSLLFVLLCSHFAWVIRRVKLLHCHRHFAWVIRQVSLLHCCLHLNRHLVWVIRRFKLLHCRLHLNLHFVWVVRQVSLLPVLLRYYCA